GRKHTAVYRRISYRREVLPEYQFRAEVSRCREELQDDPPEEKESRDLVKSDQEKQSDKRREACPRRFSFVEL
ncbi:MAG: hypothetical protein IKI59_01980, partial [Clostridia bacterium]|nr:hypothetical protein [Clostridia bacterium]